MEIGRNSFFVIKVARLHFLSTTVYPMSRRATSEWEIVDILHTAFLFLPFKSRLKNWKPQNDHALKNAILVNIKILLYCKIFKNICYVDLSADFQWMKNLCQCLYCWVLIVLGLSSHWLNSMWNCFINWRFSCVPC